MVTESKSPWCAIYRHRWSKHAASPTYKRSKSLYDTSLYHFAILVAIKLFHRLRKRHGAVLFLTDNICVKYSPFTTLGEASSLRFVAENTAVPVPRVICAFTHKQRTYIVMERVKGDVLGCEWSKRSPTDRSDILAQLRIMVQDMRSLPAPPSGNISNVDGGPLYDCRVPGSSNNFGPFKNVSAFHEFLRGGAEADKDNFPQVNELIALQDRSSTSSLSFTHGDLGSSNILVQGNKVVAIVDWENAGWLPSYWEYTNAYNVNPQNQFWQAEVDRFLDPQPEQLHMEKLRRKYFGDV